MGLLVYQKPLRVSSSFARFKIRAYVTSVAIEEKDIKKSVFVSESNDIFTNLALEDWLYRNYNFDNNHVLMLWQNNPCVVIGRHQNPWLEANVSRLKSITQSGVKLARRNSGGGTVFHDEGNLNMTFFTSRNNYNRKYNLEIITRALLRGFNIKVDISSREDLILRDYKVSGTAAKLGRPSAYHHCTFLVNANKPNLSEALHKDNIDIVTNATKSIKSKIMNLCEENPQISVKKLFNVIGWEYLRTAAFTFQDNGMEFANAQNGFQVINPTEQSFPGIDDLRKNFESWEWRFGRTPKFTISHSFPVPKLLGDVFGDVRISITVEQGMISDINIYEPPELITAGISRNVNVMATLAGLKFSEDSLDNFEWSTSSCDKDRFVYNCVRQMLQSL